MSGANEVRGREDIGAGYLAAFWLAFQRARMDGVLAILVGYNYRIYGIRANLIKRFPNKSEYSYSCQLHPVNVNNICYTLLGHPKIGRQQRVMKEQYIYTSL